MKLEEIRQIAKLHNLKISRATKKELICAIQQAEGNRPCFAGNQAASCRQYDCLWRADCV